MRAHRQRVPRPRAHRRDHRDRRQDAAVPPGGGDARQDRQQRLGRLRVLLGAHHARGAGRRARSARRHARHDGAAQPAAVRAATRASSRAPTASWPIRSTRPTRRTGAPKPNIRNAYRTLVPLAADGPWSQALGPTHFSWMFLDETPPGPAARRPARAVVRLPHQSGDLVLGHDGAGARRWRSFPFVVAIAYTRDETNHFADILLPDAIDLESLQLIRIGGSKYIEQFWKHEGYALRQPVVEPQRRRARLHRHRHRARAPHRPARALQRLDQPRRRRRAARRAKDGTFRSIRSAPTAATRSGTRSARRRAPS